jgi:hypothetical protein
MTAWKYLMERHVQVILQNPVMTKNGGGLIIDIPKCTDHIIQTKTGHNHTLPIKFRQTLNTMRLPGYEKYHRELRLGKVKSGLLIVQMSGGWGNRYYTLMGSLPLSVALNRALIIDFPDLGTMTTALEPNLIDWRPWNVSLRPPSLDGWTDIDVKTMDETDFQRQLTADIVYARIPNFKDEYGTWSRFLHGLAHKKGIDLNTLTHREVFNFLFQTTPTVERKIRELLLQLTYPSNELFLAMHIRTGGDELSESNPNNVWFVDMEDALTKMPRAARAAMLEHNLPNDTRWLVATDNIEFGKAMKTAHPENVILSNTDLQLVDGLHIDKGGTREGTVLTFADWLLLTRAPIFIQGGSSSFSTSARMLRGLPCKHMPWALRSAVKIDHKLPIIKCG